MRRFVAAAAPVAEGGTDWPILLAVLVAGALGLASLVRVRRAELTPDVAARPRRERGAAAPEGGRSRVRTENEGD